MADSIIITCPECGDKFKSTSDKEGKKIRCPECDEPFRVTEKLISYPKGTKPPPAKTKPSKPAAPPQESEEEAKPALAPANIPAADDDDLDADGKPYVIGHVEVKNRCPACAKEMADEKAFVCLYCGYNSITRQVGRTEKTFDLSAGELLAHLGPALGSLAFAISLVFFLLWLCILFPAEYGDSWMWFLDSESMRMWITIICCFLLFSAGSYSFNKFIFDPKPKEREK